MATERTEPIQSSKSRSEGLDAQTRTDLVERHLAPAIGLELLPELAGYIPQSDAHLQQRSLSCVRLLVPLWGFMPQISEAVSPWRRCVVSPMPGGLALPSSSFGALVREARPCRLIGLSSGLCTVDKPCLKTQSTTQGVFPEP